MKYIASVSWGKDSLAMLLLLIRKREPLDEVVFYDTGMEFDAIYRTRDMVLPLLKEKGIRYTEIRPEIPFLTKMFAIEVKKRDGSIGYGYDWCGGVCRWGTTEKLRALDRYAEKENAVMYVGIAADEKERLVKEWEPYKRFPLAEWGVNERGCRRYCMKNGFRWEEDGVQLYHILKRVSCWCCRNKNLTELKNIYIHLPKYWEKLKALQSRTCRPMKGPGKSVFELENRFRREIEKRNRKEG